MNKASLVLKLNGLEIKSSIDGKDFLDAETVNRIKEDLNRTLNENISAIERKRNNYDTDYVNKSFEFDPKKVIEGDKAQIYFVIHYLSNGNVYNGTMTRDFRATDTESTLDKDSLKYIWSSDAAIFEYETIASNRQMGTYRINNGSELVFDPMMYGINPFISTADIMMKGSKQISSYVREYGIESLISISENEMFIEESRSIFKQLIARSIYNYLRGYISDYMDPDTYAALLTDMEFDNLDAAIRKDFINEKSIKDNAYLKALFKKAYEKFNWTPDVIIDSIFKTMMKNYPIHSSSKCFVGILDLIDIVQELKIVNSEYYVSENYICGDRVKTAYQNMYVDFRKWYSDDIYQILPKDYKLFCMYLLQFNNDIGSRVLLNSEYDWDDDRSRTKNLNMTIDEIREKYAKDKTDIV